MMILYIVYVITNSLYARLVYLLARTIEILNPPTKPLNPYRFPCIEVLNRLCQLFFSAVRNVSGNKCKINEYVYLIYTEIKHATTPYHA